MDHSLGAFVWWDSLRARGLQQALCAAQKVALTTSVRCSTFYRWVSKW